MKFSNCHDGLIAHHAYASHFKQSLAEGVSEYCDAAPWKEIYKGGDDEKGVAPPDMTAENLQAYGAADARLTYLVWGRMQFDLAPERSVYEQDLRLASITREMSRAGIGIDSLRKAELRLALIVRASELLANIRAATGNPNYRPSAQADARAFLYKDMGLHFTKLTKGGLPATDEGVLEALRSAANPQVAAFADALLNWRVVDKIRSTYIDAIGKPGDRGIPYHKGRAHYNWKPWGTVSGRFASRFQSVPKMTAEGSAGPPETRIREIYIPKPGCVFVYYDVSQAEMRLAAYLSNDRTFIEACSGDVHWNNACIVMPECRPLGPKGGKKFRDMAKNIGFAISYCAEADKLYATLQSKGFQVPMPTCVLILNKLHAAYRIYYRWVESNLARCRRSGHLRSPFVGRIRWLGWYPKITDVANFPIQSGLADVVNARTIALDERLPPEARLVAQVHDACIYEVPETSASQVKSIISEIWSRPLDTPGGQLILPIDLKIGERLSEF